MHTSALAFESTTMASVLSLTFGLITVYAYALGLRLHWMLFGAAGWFGLALYFGLLAVSAGPAPVIARADMALGLRVSLIVAYALFATCFSYLVRMLVRFGMLWFGGSER